MSLSTLPRRSLPPQVRARGVTAVLGPTNTGKTHLAIERMLGHDSGMIGLPLRLLAREVYARVVEKAGVHNVALITGEEKIKPDRPRYWVSTVEAMPRDLDLSFVAVDEIQLAADMDRGHVFTDRLLNQRGRSETMLIGSGTMRPLVEALIPGVHVVTRPRLSKLTFAGEKKVSRLKARSAIVAFSAEEVYAIAELLRRQRGGAAVVLGALSPRTRNAQVELYQSGDVDYLVATDAVGMGLNLDVDHVAFASDKKFDGHRFRKLFPAELGQIAGRAGRHLRDGTFATSGRCPPFEPELIEALESHHFDSLKVLQWRNPDLDFASIARLQASLAEVPREHGLTRAQAAEDVLALDILSREDEVRDLAGRPAAVQRLWEVCQVPDYRKISPANHADLVGQIYRYLMRDGFIPSDWFARQVAMLDRMEGDIEILSNRIAQVRTWTFVANRPDWLKDPEHWQGVTRQVEDRLSDALHERLASRFVDRRTSVLMRRLRENAMLEAEITATGDVTVEGQHVGRLNGFHFVADPLADPAQAQTLRNAAAKALAGEIDARAERLSGAPDAQLVLSNDGTLRWQGDPVARMEPGEKLDDPRLRLVADEQLTGPAREKVEVRLRAWLKAYIVRLLGPALQLETAPELTGLARGIGFQVAEALGVLERSKVLQDVRSLDQDGRAALRKLGVRFGAYHLYLPALLKPAPRTLAAQLWALKNGGLDQRGLDEIAHLAGSGRTSIPVDPEIARGLYRSAGFRVCGARAVRVDILERLADLIRPAVTYRPGVTPGDPPPGAADGDGFVATVGMTSLVGCSGEDFASILKSLGYAVEARPGPAITVPLVPAGRPLTPASGTAQTPQADSAAETVPAPEMIAAPGEASAAEPSGTDADSEVAGAADAEAVSDDPTIETVAAEPAAEAEVALAEDGVMPGEEGPSLGLAADEESAVAADIAAEVVPTPMEVAAAPAEARESSGTQESIEAQESTETQEPVEAPASGEASEPVAVAEASPEGDGAAPAAPPEPVMIEVWRQNRHQRAEGRPARPRHNRHGGRERPAGERAEARPAGEGPRRDERPHRDRPRGDRPGQGGERRPEQRAEGRPHQGQGEGQGRPPRRDDGRPGGPRRDDRRDDRRPGGGPRAEARNDRPPRREREPDPNSPFAKLLALKEQLEGRDKR